MIPLSNSFLSVLVYPNFLPIDIESVLGCSAKVGACLAWRRSWGQFPTLCECMCASERERVRERERERERQSHSACFFTLCPFSSKTSLQSFPYQHGLISRHLFNTGLYSTV
jgi:hypothetical protein